jgi:S-DNA-T family DNA segregation ATPase FtsK/SpoIIIE
MYFRVRTKAKHGYGNGIKGAGLFLVAFVVGYCLLLPAQAGVLGQAIAKVLFVIFGQTSFMIPLILAWMGWMLFNPGYQPRWRIDAIWSLLIVMVGASFLSLFGNLFYGQNFGGWVGLKLNPFFYRLFGNYLSLAITAVLFLYLASLLLRVSLRLLCMEGWRKLVEDYRQWQEARAELKQTMTSIPAKVKTGHQERPVIKQQELKLEPKPQPKIVVQEVKPQIKPPLTVKETKKEVKPADRQPEKPSTSSIAYQLPPLDFLSVDKGSRGQSREDHLANAELLTKTLADFDIEAKVKEIIPGPVVTRYDMELAPGIKIQSVAALTDNISLAMRAPAIRIVPIPEKSAVGVEVPNAESAIVGLRGILDCSDFQSSSSLLTLALGKTTDGMPYVTDLASMPHLLIAGATGSGKSVGVHSIILSMLYKARPDELKFLLIDPKRVEMPIYRSLPHLYDPRVPAEKADIITQPKEAAQSLQKLVRVMEQRYERYAKETVRNIEGYNEKMAERGGEKDYYIVVIIDELADLMLVASNDVEDSIQRLAQMARAVGIHLILTTQRPSVNVITGVIKANFPARIAFQTTSKVDSRVILDTIGADALLGKGDMLFMPPGESRCSRLQGAFVSVKEAEKVIQFIAQQNFPRQYEPLAVRTGGNGTDDFNPEEADRSMKELLSALKLMQERKRISQDLLKAHFGSSARATNLLSLLETKGFIHKPEGTNRWTIHYDLISEYIAAMGGNTGDDSEAVG